MSVEHPFHHEPSHLRKTRKEIMRVKAKSGYPIERIWNDIASFRKLCHQDAFRVGIFAKPTLNFVYCVGVSQKLNPCCSCSALSRTIVRRCANSSETKNDVVG